MLERAVRYWDKTTPRFLKSYSPLPAHTQNGVSPPKIGWAHPVLSIILSYSGTLPRQAIFLLWQELTSVSCFPGVHQRPPSLCAFPALRAGLEVGFVCEFSLLQAGQISKPYTPSNGMWFSLEVGRAWRLKCLDPSQWPCREKQAGLADLVLWVPWDCIGEWGEKGRVYIFMCMHTYENGIMCVYIFVWVCKYMHICTGIEVHQGEDGTVCSCMYVCVCVWTCQSLDS